MCPDPCRTQGHWQGSVACPWGVQGLTRAVQGAVQSWTRCGQRHAFFCTPEKCLPESKKRSTGPSRLSIHGLPSTLSLSKTWSHSLPICSGWMAACSRPSPKGVGSWLCPWERRPKAGLPSPLHCGEETTILPRCINFQYIRLDRSTGQLVAKPRQKKAEGTSLAAAETGPLSLGGRGWTAGGRLGWLIVCGGRGWWEPGGSAWKSFFLPSEHGRGQGDLQEGK